MTWFATRAQQATACATTGRNLGMADDIDEDAVRETLERLADGIDELVALGLQAWRESCALREAESA